MRRALAIAMLALLLAPLEVPASAPLLVESTPVHSLERMKLPNNLSYSKAIAAGLHVVFGSEGLVGKVDLRKQAVEGVMRVVGNVTSLSVDAVPAQWVTVGTGRGEVVVATFEELAQRANFYVASRGAVRSVHILRVEEGARLVALDDKGFLYVMRVHRGGIGGGWFEVGPVPHLGALAGIYGIRVTHVYPVINTRGWTSYYYEGDKVVAITDSAIPGRREVDQFLGGISAEVYYGSPAEPAVTGTFQSDGALEERRLYYAIVHSSFIVPYEGAGGLSEAQNYTLSLHGLFPQEYKVLLLYEIRRTGGERLAESACYAKVVPAKVKPGSVTFLGAVVLERMGSSLSECLERVRVDGKRFYELARPVRVQAMLLIDTTRLPLLAEFDRDVRTLLIPISREMAEGGLSDLRAHAAAVFMRPGVEKPRGWENIDAMLVVAAGEWLFIYYFDRGLRLAEVGYAQPQFIYIGDPITSLEVAPNAKRIYVGTRSGTMYRLLWISDFFLLPPLEKRYFLDSSLKVDTTPITSLAELEGGELLLTTSESGRVQMVRLRESLEPLWRGSEGLLGLETLSPGIVAASRGVREMILLLPQSSEIYWFKAPLQELMTLRLDLRLVSFDEEGSWSIGVPPGDVEIAVVSRGAVVAKSVARDGKAALYLPRDSYDLLFTYEGMRSRPLRISVSRSEEVKVVLVPRADALIAERGENETQVRRIVESNIPRVNVEARLVDADGNPVLESLRAVLYGPGGRFVAAARMGVLTFPQVPVGLYTISIEEPGPKYEPYISALKVTMRGAEPQLLVLQPRKVELTVKVIDGLLNTPVTEPFRLAIERLEIGSPELAYPREVTISRGSGKLALPRGTYRITAIPTSELYLPATPIVYRAEEEGTLEVRVLPREFPLTVRVKNSWGEPVKDARITLVRLEGGYVSDFVAHGTALTELLAPHGLYELVVSANMYRGASVEVDIPNQREVEVILEPTPQLMMLRYAPYAVVLLATLAGAYVLNALRKAIEERMRQEYF
ncbi:MAG: hypothetical protein N3F67_03330 [Acidilobaceae archaeon]|nr:hypothetical protein [Acidilobaceae archaeon]